MESIVLFVLVLALGVLLIGIRAGAVSISETFVDGLNVIKGWFHLT